MAISKGKVGILNVGAGDTKIIFDPDKPKDIERASQVVSELIRRGFVLVVDSGRRDAKDRPIYTRAKWFDATKHEYIIQDDEETTTDEPTAAQGDGAAAAPAVRRGGKTKRVSAAGVNAIAVARSAGG